MPATFQARLSASEMKATTQPHVRGDTPWLKAAALARNSQPPHGVSLRVGGSPGILWCVPTRFPSPEPETCESPWAGFSAFSARYHWRWQPPGASRAPGTTDTASSSLAKTTHPLRAGWQSQCQPTPALHANPLLLSTMRGPAGVAQRVSVASIRLGPRQDHPLQVSSNLFT